VSISLFHGESYGRQVLRTPALSISGTIAQQVVTAKLAEALGHCGRPPSGLGCPVSEQSSGQGRVGAIPGLRDCDQLCAPYKINYQGPVPATPPGASYPNGMHAPGPMVLARGTGIFQASRATRGRRVRPVRVK
jgi:hypothetical protein